MANSPLALPLSLPTTTQVPHRLGHLRTSTSSQAGHGGAGKLRGTLQSVYGESCPSASLGPVVWAGPHVVVWAGQPVHLSPPPLCCQVLLSELVKSWGDAKFEGFVRQGQALYCARAEAACRAAKEHLGALAEFIVPRAGMFMWLHLTGDRGGGAGRGEDCGPASLRDCASAAGRTGDDCLA